MTVPPTVHCCWTSHHHVRYFPYDRSVYIAYTVGKRLQKCTTSLRAPSVILSWLKNCRCPTFSAEASETHFGVHHLLPPLIVVRRTDHYNVYLAASHASATSHFIIQRNRHSINWFIMSGDPSTPTLASKLVSTTVEHYLLQTAEAPSICAFFACTTSISPDYRDTPVSSSVNIPWRLKLLSLSTWSSVLMRNGLSHLSHPALSITSPQPRIWRSPDWEPTSCLGANGRKKFYH